MIQHLNLHSQLINTSFIILRNLLFAIAFLIKPEKVKQKIYPKL